MVEQYIDTTKIQSFVQEVSLGLCWLFSSTKQRSRKVPIADGMDIGSEDTTNSGVTKALLVHEPFVDTDSRGR